MLKDLFLFYRCFFYFLFGGKVETCPYFKSSKQTQVHILSLALIFYMWDKPHYRSKDFRDDMLKNLSNVVIPGTGFPLSRFCYFRLTAYFCVLLVYPLAALCAAINKSTSTGKSVSQIFRHHLLTPTDWFAFWQLNCRLVSFHFLHTAAQEFENEDKWTFLQLAKRHNVAVTPWLDTKAIIVKHRNEEGGLGIFKYVNATEGGNWIIQECLSNGPFLMKFLPKNAPLSTFRVITISDGGMTGNARDGYKGNITALSCVFRAGRAGASTDHSSVLFDVDVTTGTILKGTSNAHWYERGLHKFMRTRWQPDITFEHHPDSGAKLTGVVIPDFSKVLKLAEDGHRLFPRVPICGWDVALTDSGLCLIEVNFMCNFFQATFNHAQYFDFVHKYMIYLQKEKLAVH